MVLLRLEIINDYWVVEKNPSGANLNNEYLYKRKRYWDSYNLLKSSPVIYWEQPLTFEQFANNIWANGFVALLDSPTGIGPKQRAEFIFETPFIPDNCVVSCRIAYNATGILFRFPDPMNTKSIRQIRITGSTVEHPNGSVIFSIIHTYPQRREDIYSWNWSSRIHSSSSSNNPYLNSVQYSTPIGFIRSTSNIFEKINSSVLNFTLNHGKSSVNASYDLDFRLDSKYTTQIYPLIIHPLNRFYDLDSYYMTELSDICNQNQGFSDIKNNLQMAEDCYNKMYRLFTTYPFLVHWCLWLNTPSKTKQQKHYRKNLRMSHRLKHNSSYYQELGFNNSFVDNRNYNQSTDFYNNDSRSMRYNINDPNEYQARNEFIDYPARNDSFINPITMSQAPFYNFNRSESVMFDNIQMESYNNNNNNINNNNSMYFEKSFRYDDDEYYEYQQKRMEIMRIKLVLEKLAFFIQYIQYSSPLLFTAILLYIYKKKAREWIILFKCAYQLITYQLKDPYVIVTSPKRKRINH
ncbi:hypothetical protein BCR36DRAFT_355469 [Piromyces finnis]|uniref:Uncharacterized protein n=1 Tax=Piromyces finnis TaxID=1754191 RepID=A0A1Y1V5Z6_9FUNG|nr:hypothetical protein BCR36DRAFT_355469 [Piromyces finnis]|eukprot:ORX47940.1 hypothetical protein BCR36DRAFT_355469 [Piromyces finnis]